MSIGLNIDDFTPDQLKEMVLSLQAVIQSERVKREMDSIRIKALEMEISVCRDLLGRQLISLVVGPTMIPTGIFTEKPKEGETGEEKEEAKPVTTDGSEKDKFQA